MQLIRSYGPKKITILHSQISIVSKKTQKVWNVIQNHRKWNKMDFVQRVKINIAVPKILEFPRYFFSRWFSIYRVKAPWLFPTTMELNNDQNSQGKWKIKSTNVEFILLLHPLPPPPPTTTRPPISALERQIQPYLFGHLHPCKKKVPAQVFPSN